VWYDCAELGEEDMPVLAPPPARFFRAETYGFDPTTPTFTVEQYQQMIRGGILTHDSKLELLENYMVKKMPRNPPHDGTIQLVMASLMPHIPPGWNLRCQLTVVTGDSQPEPDFAIVKGTPRTYLEKHPSAKDVGLIIEVSDSSLLRDQRDKFRIFARAAVPCYWIMNLQESRIEVYTQPSGPNDVPAYREFRNYSVGESIPLVLDGVEVTSVPVADLLP